MQTTDISKIYWIWLAEGLGQGSRLAAKLLAEYEDAKAIYQAKDSDLRLYRSWRDNDLLQFAQLLKNRELRRATEILNQCQKNAIGILTYDDPAFPSSLRCLSNPPLVLYYRGTFPDTTSYCTIGVVGTRTMTDYGRDMAYSLGAGLASGGAVVVSGLALGADSMAMVGAMDADGVTVGVLGCGVDVVYPPAHRPLYEQVLAHGGCILSEYPPLSRPLGFHFPVRNRIISGLSDGVVVVEADSKSGALITARHAVYQGKTLFAVPGQVGSRTAEGPNALLRDGALPVLSAADVLEEFAFPYAKTVHPEKAAQFFAKWNGTERAREAMEREQVGIRGRDLPAAHDRPAQPVHEAAPVRAPEQDDRHLGRLVGLHERERLERLVEGAEATGKNNRAARVLDEHRLAHEEVPERHAEVNPAVHTLLMRQLDAEAHRLATRARRSPVCCLHDAGAATCDDGEATLGKKPSCAARRGIHWIIALGAGRAKAGDGGAEIRQGAKAIDKHGLDAKNAPGIHVEPLGRILGVEEFLRRASLGDEVSSEDDWALVIRDIEGLV